jgi:hypothetical protein
MSFVTVSGSALDEPSFLELIAAQRLERSFKDAFWYSLSVWPLGTLLRLLLVLPWGQKFRFPLQYQARVVTLLKSHRLLLCTIGCH